MIDTIKIGFPIFSQADKEKIEKKLMHKMKITGDTGEIISVFTSDSLRGTWDSRISCHISEYMHKYIEVEKNGVASGGRVVLVEREKPVVFCECSLAKFLFGTNVLNYSLETAMSGIVMLQNWILDFFELDYEIKDDQWLIERIDIARNYQTISASAYFTSLRYLSYPRRKAPVPYPTGIYFAGERTTFKIYDKKAEFIKHDKKRFNELTAEYLTKKAENVVRFEVELHKKYLLNREIRTLADLRNGEEMWKNELEITRKKCMIGVDGRITKEEQVLEFCKKYDWKRKKITPDAFFSYWVVAATQGDARAKEFFGQDKRTRVKKIMKENGLSFVTDILVNQGISELTEIKDLKFQSDCAILGMVPGMMLLAA